MDPLSALGLATAVIQITQFSGELIRGARHASQTADGLLLSNANIKEVAETLSSLTAQLVISRDPLALSREETLLREIGSQCQDVSASILSRLRKLQQKQSRNSWNNVSQTFTQLLSQGETNALAAKLGSIREQLDTTLLICLR